jgi:hypothetical protein
MLLIDQYGRKVKNDFIQYFEKMIQFISDKELYEKPVVLHRIHVKEGGSREAARRKQQGQRNGPRRQEDHRRAPHPGMAPPLQG